MLPAHRPSCAPPASSSRSRPPLRYEWPQDLLLVWRFLLRPAHEPPYGRPQRPGRRPWPPRPLQAKRHGLQCLRQTVDVFVQTYLPGLARKRASGKGRCGAVIVRAFSLEDRQDPLGTIGSPRSNRTSVRVAQCRRRLRQLSTSRWVRWKDL
jgi:hypothetical protein